MMRSASNDFADNLTDSIQNQSDPAMVQDGIPAYLLLLDAMLRGDPDNEPMLRAAASLNGAYAGLLLEEKARQQIISQKALDYAAKAVCLHHKSACNIQTLPFEEFSNLINSIGKEDVPVYYTLATAWAGWVQANADDWNAVAQLAQVERILQKIVELDADYENGNTFMYLGVITTLLPPAMGGRPEIGREHFERAIALSQGKNLMAKVLYARHYARLVFDRELHDRLVGEVLAANPQVPGFTLINTIAQQQAKQLSDSATEYF